MAAADRFWARVQGRGGHGAMPHLAVDPVVAAAAIVAALQPLVSRETSPTSAAVVTVAELNTGEPTVVSGLLKAACAAPLRALHVARQLWRPRSLPCLRPRLHAASGIANIAMLAMFWHWAGVDDNAPNGEGSTICAPAASAPN